MTPVPSEDVVKKRTPSDFIFGKVIGEGSFSTVYLAKDIHTNKEFAIKVLEKMHIKREKKMEYVTREKDVLLKLSSSTNLFVRLYCTFQDIDRLYFVLTYAKNSDLLAHLNANFTLESSKFYAAEVLLALETLNSKGIIHRDLKPENILIDENWHILLTDFGSAKIVTNQSVITNSENNEKRKNSFVGTAQYVTPEVLTDGEITYALDLWALGCVIYQMISGSAPFKAGSEYLIFKKILSLEYEFPDNFNFDAKDLIEKLLVLIPQNRLGANDDTPYASIRQHVFFREINWDNLGEPPKMGGVDIEIEPKIEMISDNLEPGFDEQKASKLQLELFCPAVSSAPTRKKSDTNRNIANLDESEVRKRLEMQKTDKFHHLVEENLILKQGLVEKRKGLFARRRMLLLTRGPHLYYVDPTTMVLKGEIPWSSDIKAEAKNFQIFHIHTPNRIYYLEDPEKNALLWCKAIDEVKAYYYPEKSDSNTT